jgi:predicted enzyme related to lactoylglutathione lyase
MLPYVMVEDVERTLQEAATPGGQIATPRTALGPREAFATIRDPAGNLIGICQNP